MSEGGVLTSEMASLRARPVTLHNSRILLGMTYAGSLAAAFMALCTLLMVGSILFPSDQSPWSFGRAWSAIIWATWTFFLGQMCPFLWKQASKMAHVSAKMDERGVDFHLGTKKNPADLFLEWEKIVSIRQKRVGNAQEFTVTGSDKSFARFTSYTFFRPKKVARLITERTGLKIEKS